MQWCNQRISEESPRDQRNMKGFFLLFYKYDCIKINERIKTSLKI